MEEYNFKDIEKKWQKKWDSDGVYKTSEGTDKPKYYILDMFPYPSGEGLHVGHPKGYIATDVYARQKMMQGYNVLHPMGWDAFGLPAENYAIKNKVHPKVAVEKNVKRFKEQLEKIGFTYDWSREVNTTDPEFYKWTQWTFLKMLEKGLAYESHEPINWCPTCQTGLANEDLEDGRCERCDSEIEQKPMRQWVLKITDYADRMLEGLDKLDWEESIKEQQRNWIGRSEGAEIDFEIKDSEDKIKVFTTRPDTLFGCTYMVLSPEHKLIDTLKDKIENWSEAEKYIKNASKKSDLERTELAKDKTGVKVEGVMAINPANQEEVPIFIADYVLAHYGTGAIMSVPAHDERDFEFAKKYGIKIKEVVTPCFIKTGGDDAFRDNDPIVEREAITAIVKHWSEDKYIVLRWKKVDWHTFITGGVEEGQTPEEAARTEVLEETGYKNIKVSKELKRFHAKFFHVPKKVNRFAHFHSFYFELENGEKEELTTEEKENHNVLWLAEKELLNILTPPGHLYVWDDLKNREKAYIGEGKNVNSGFLDGLETTGAKKKMIEWLEKKEIGKGSVNYKLNDWVFSRQRYWGEPIPVIHCDKCGVVPVPEKDLPVMLPDVEKYEPTGTGESPLSAIDDWVNVDCPKCGIKAKRETNTMPQWAGSSWYYLRYIDPKNKEALVDKKKEKYWSPVDFYVGGAEHATRHLIYARFWHKFLFDIGVVNYDEPFKKLQHVGLIMAEDGRKMSKRWGNVINPDEVIEKYGADTLRLYEMFMGPFAQAIAWDTKSMEGSHRFLLKVWKIIKEKKMTECGGDKGCGGTSKELINLFHKTIKKVTEDIEGFRFNTAISQMMILINYISKLDSVPRGAMKKFLQLLAPFAPHFSEELWASLGEKKSIFLEEWPKYNPELIKDEEINLVVQVNGKVRENILVSADIEEDEAKELTLSQESVKKWIEGKDIVKIIFVKGRLINIVAK